MHKREDSKNGLYFIHEKKKAIGVICGNFCEIPSQKRENWVHPILRAYLWKILVTLLPGVANYRTLTTSEVYFQ